jgi:hypothetical protein
MVWCPPWKGHVYALSLDEKGNQAMVCVRCGKVK